MKIKKLFELPTSRLWIYPVFFGAALRFWGLISSSIWHDEGYTMWLLRFNFLEIIERTARDVHPPGYYLIAKPWVMILGSSEFAVRTLSVLFSVGIVYLVYKIVEKMFSQRAAFWASMFVAFSPFMIRFAQEARMYGVVAFFATLGTYFLVRFIKEKNNKLLIPYALAMLIAIYTQYYAFFVIIVHWIAVATVTPGFFKLRWGDSWKKKLYLFNPYWWLAGVALFIAYLPWFYVAFKQVTRVDGGYWIKPEWITIKTIPNSIFQFLSYSHLDSIYSLGIEGKLFYWLAAAGLVVLPLILILVKKLPSKLWLFYLYGYLPMVLVYALSELKTPIYQDRYFPFSAVAILAIWGIMIASVKGQKMRDVLGTATLAVFVFGGVIMHIDTNHQMKALSEAVKKEMREGDVVLSGELYTFLDGTYYFGDKNIRLLSDKVSGYGETSLFYDKQSEYLVSEDKISELGDRVFVIGKNGDKNYFSECLWGAKTAKTIFTEAKQGGLKAILYENE